MNYFWLILSGVGMGLVAAVPVGPVNIICVRRTFAYGPLNGFVSGMGAALGDGVFAAITGLGLTWIAQLIEGYAALIQVVSGLIMVFFGIKIFLDSHEPQLAGDEADKGGTSLLRAIASTFALTITNPATLIAFTVMFGGLGGLGGGPGSFVDAGFVVAGVVGGSAAWWLALTTIIGLFHARIDAKVVVTINRVCGVLVAIFGLVVLGNLVWGLLRRF